MTRRWSVVTAAAILTAVATGAFVISSMAVSSASSPASPDVGLSSAHPFSKFTLTGVVSTANPLAPRSFTLKFTTAFTLAPNSPGIVSGNNLGAVTIEQHVSYPVPAKGSFVGPVALPFAAESLKLQIGVLGSCFPFAASANQYVFTGTVSKCVTASLTLGPKKYSVKRLLTSVGGSFTPSPTGASSWNGVINATFLNPGYTFPVATLGSGGSTMLTIGSNGGDVRTQSVAFAN